MPTAIKRRKLSTTSRNASSQASSRGIGAFTKVSKGRSSSKIIIEKNDFADTIAIASLDSPINCNKRKLVTVTEEQSTEECVTAILSTAPDHREIKSLPKRRAPSSQEYPQTPRKPIQSRDALSSADTPTKGTRSLLDRFCISSKTPTRSPLGFNNSSASILQSTPEHKYTQSSQELPSELLDLINLHAAFLTALSLHCAHNGVNSPADLRNLCSDVARAWGKRRVSPEDIRRTLGVLNANIAEGSKEYKIFKLSLSDYGHGKICVEIEATAIKSGFVARPVNENYLNEVFVRGLRAAWKERAIDIDLKEFVESLPLEPITICPSLANISPLLAKGQQRLEDLKAGIILKKDNTKQKAQEESNAAGTKPTLLERLRAKQLYQSSLPPPPSKEELARKAALQRLDEVIAVLTILSTSSSIGQQRISFTLPTVVGKLKDSFKNAMSKEEADRCIRVLTSEIAPDWVKLVKMGKVEDYVVYRDGRPADLEIRERIKRAA